MLETLSQNSLRPQVRRLLHGGRYYLVADSTLLVPGVLAGSQGPLFYPPKEVAKSPSAWDGFPITVYHPVKNGQPVSASEDGVLDRQGIGFVKNSKLSGKGKLKAQLWIDEEKAKRVDVRVVDSLLQGKPIELSTGLFTKNEEAAPGSNWQGKAFTHVARDYRPDHVAILPDVKGACSLEDGCGVLVNVNVENALPNQPRSQVTGSYKPMNAGTGKGEPHEAAQSGFAMISDVDRARGNAASIALEKGFEFPPFVDPTTQGKWSRAVTEVTKKGSPVDKESLTLAAHVYAKLGGRFVDNQAACKCEVANSNPEGINQYSAAAKEANSASAKARKSGDKRDHATAALAHVHAATEATDPKKFDEHMRKASAHANVGKTGTNNSEQGLPALLTNSELGESSRFDSDWQRRDAFDLFESWGKLAANAEEGGDGSWITISGTHVMVKDGEIVHGPQALKDHAAKRKESAKESSKGGKEPSAEDKADAAAKSEAAAKRSGIAVKVNKDRQAKEHGKAADAHMAAAEAHDKIGNRELADKHLKAAEEHTAKAHSLTKNQREEPMTREQMISHLTTNCKAWSGSGDKDILANLSDSKLRQLVLDAPVANKEGKCPECGGKMVDGECEDCGYKEDVENDRYGSPEAKARAVAATTAAGKSPGTAAGAGAGATGASVTTKSPKMNECGGGDMKPTKNQQDATTNSNGKAKQMTTNEWLAAAPPEVQSVVRNALAVEQRERQHLVSRLTANVADEAERKRIGDSLINEDLAKLRMLASLIPTANQGRGQPTVNGFRDDGNPMFTFESGPNYRGAAAGPTNNQHQPIVNEADDNDVLPLPVINWEELVKEQKAG